MLFRGLKTALFALMLFAAASNLRAEDRFITVASTTSTEQSGLFEYLLPLFTKETGIAVHVVAVGTGQALSIGERGDADALLVHDRIGEDKFVAAGFGIDRRDVMVNDFVIIGPAADPAKIRETKDVAESFRRIAHSGAPFASRGDDSGTNRMELRLWKTAGVDVGGSWYRDLGQGMGPTLNTAALLEGDQRLLNPYATILVNPANHASVKAGDAKIWHEWLTSPAGQAVIAGYRVGEEQLFFPSAKP